jgi:hypothetical protein
MVVEGHRRRYRTRRISVMYRVARICGTIESYTYGLKAELEVIIFLQEREVAGDGFKVARGVTGC